MTRRKDGLWQQAMTVVVNGRKTQKYFYGQTKSEVLRKIQTYKDEQSEGLTFEEVADKWWETHEPTLAANTTKSYKPALERAKARFGKQRIQNLQATDVDRFLKDFIKEKKPARKTAATQLMVVNLIFKYAVSHGHARYNPARDVSLPRNLSKKERKLPTQDDIRKVKASVNVPFGMFAYWVLYTGCRRGELQALTWEDVDLKNNWINISKSLYYKNGKAALKLPKTEKGIRRIPLLRKLAEQIHPGTGIIFSNIKGTYLTEYEFQECWAKYVEASGVTCTPHQLRHAYATMLYENKVDPKDMQQLLGHAQLSTTMDIYTHIREEYAKREQARLLDVDIKA